MGMTKRLMEEQEDKRALRIAVRAGTWKAYDFHDEVYDHDGDPEAAYRLGTARYRDDELENDYSDRREVTDCIKATIREGMGQARERQGLTHLPPIFAIAPVIPT